MSMKADTSHILMSDQLRGNVPAIEDDPNDVLKNEEGKYVTVVAERIIGQTADTMFGVLRGVLLGNSVEIEIRCSVVEALKVIHASQLSFTSFEIHHGMTAIPIPGPFIVKEARIDEISPRDEMCTLGLHLSKRTA